MQRVLYCIIFFKNSELQYIWILYVRKIFFRDFKSNLRTDERQLCIINNRQNWIITIFQHYIWGLSNLPDIQGPKTMILHQGVTTLSKKTQQNRTKNVQKFFYKILCQKYFLKFGKIIGNWYKIRVCIVPKKLPIEISLDLK